MKHNLLVCKFATPRRLLTQISSGLGILNLPHILFTLRGAIPTLKRSLKYKADNYRLHMQQTDDFFTSFSYEKEIERVKWFKNDLDNGGWNEVHNNSGAVYWQKTFPENEVPIKMLFKIDLPLSAESYMEMVNPKNMEVRKKWDQVFRDQEIVKTYPDNQGFIFYLPFSTPWPLWDRSFMLFSPPTKEIDWFGKRAYILIQKNAWHSSKPPGADGRVRATNGGNFFVITPDEEDSNSACTLFSLSNNNYNGWIPKRHIEWMVSKAVVSSFNCFFECVIEGYNKYYKP